MKIRSVDFDKDVEKLIRLEEFWDGESLKSTKQDILLRTQRLEEWQLVLEVDGELAATVYSQPILSCDELMSVEKDSYNEKGKLLLLLGALSDPKFAHLEPAHRLINFICREAPLKGFEVVAVTRWSGFRKWKEQGSSGIRTAEEYFALNNDPTVNWHKSRGAVVERMIFQYRPRDLDNEGIGILIKYPGVLTNGASDVELSLSSSLSVSEEDAKSLLKSVVASILGVDLSSFSDQAPIFSMGLGSLGIFELRERIAEAFHVPLPPVTLFFQLSTIESLASYFSGKRGTVKENLTSRTGQAVDKRFAAISGISVGAGSYDTSTFWRALAVQEDFVTRCA